MDWVALLEANNVEYVSRGPNTKRGEVSIRCPFCGDDDPSTHMGINLTTGTWGCLRNSRHRGRSTEWLLQHLLRISNHQAKLVVRQYDAADPDSELPDPATMFDAPAEAEAAPVVLEMPNDFRRIDYRQALTRPYWSYLERRGFEHPENMIRYYKLRCALIGRWKGRIIFPIYKDGVLIAWTGRAITPLQTAPRYLTNEGNTIKTTVMNYDKLMREGGRLLSVVEGPVDALKVDYFGKPLGARATAVFGTSITGDQMLDLNRLAKRFDRVVILMDPDAVEAAFDLSEWLVGGNISVGSLPDGIEDPGAATPQQVVSYTHDMLKRWPSKK